MTADQDRYQTIAEAKQTYCPVCGRITIRRKVCSLYDVTNRYTTELWACRKCRTVTAEEVPKEGDGCGPPR